MRSLRRTGALASAATLLLAAQVGRAQSPVSNSVQDPAWDATQGSAQDSARDSGPVWLDVIELGRNEADRLLARGRQAATEGRSDDAVSAFTRAYELQPSRTDVQLALARELTLSGRWAELLEVTERLATSADRSDATARVLFFRSVGLAATGRYAEGAALLERITRYRGSLVDAEVFYGNLGELHMAAGDLDRAVLFYQQSLASNAGYVSSRVGLAAALSKAGRDAEARTQLLRAAIDDPGGTFLRVPGMFFVPEGEADLYAALVAIGAGDAAGAEAALGRYEGSVAASGAPAGYTDRLRGWLGESSVEATAIPIAGCIPILVALSPAGDRVAAWCEYGGLREARADGNGSWAADGEGQYGYGSYTAVDLAYAPDGESIRVLHSDGGVERYTRRDGALRSEGRIFYDNYALTPARFVPGGERVLFTGASSGGFMVEAWDATPVQASLSYPAVVRWLYSPAISADEATLVTVEAAALRVLRGSTWTESASVELDTSRSRFTPWGLTPDGRELVTAQGPLLVRHSSATGAPIGVVSVSALAPEVVRHPHEGISAIEPIDGSTVLFATPNGVYVIRESGR